MRRLDERERRMSLLAALMGAVASVALWAPAFDKTAGIILAAVGVLLSGLLALAARSRKRLLTCLAAVVLGFGPWGMAWLLGLPYIMLATWLLFRDRKAAAERRARQGRDGDHEEEDQEAKPERRTRARAGARSSGERPARPAASKRYTPPQRRS